MNFKVMLTCIFAMSLSACGSSSYFNQLSAVTTVAGAGLGAGVGALIASTDKDYDKGKTVAIGAGAGAAMGLIAGAMANNYEMEREKARPIVREPLYTDNPTQREIDSLRQDMRDSSSYGRGEVRPWNERYQGAHDLPYQGPGASR